MTFFYLCEIFLIKPDNISRFLILYLNMARKTIIIFYRLFLFILLTILTQIGGIIYLISIYSHKITDRWAKRKYLKYVFRLGFFLILYSISTFFLVPLIAKPFGRVPLTLKEDNHLRPLNFLTCFLNRHYVRQELKQITLDVAREMNDQFPGTTVNYLEASFPFVDGFPLVPHLSHNDGKKLDLSFSYTDTRTNQPTNDCPSFIGYGICEEPLPGEIDYSVICDTKGNWQYSLMRKIVPQANKRFYTFDVRRTKKLVEMFAQQPGIEKIFIEPHLKKRLALNSSKIRFHGCQAVRHDDHIHVQVK